MPLMAKNLSAPCRSILSFIVTTADTLKTQVAKRFTNVAAGLTPAKADSIESVKTTTDGDDAVYFQCPNPGATGNLCGNKNRGSNAYTGNKGSEGNTFNTISFCDPFFDAGTSLADDKVTYEKAPLPRRNPIRTAFDPPKAKGMRHFL